MTDHDCGGALHQHIVKSSKILLTRCALCGNFWLVVDGKRRPATASEEALAEIVAAYVRLRMPIPAGVLA